MTNCRGLLHVFQYCLQRFQENLIKGFTELQTDFHQLAWTSYYQRKSVLLACLDLWVGRSVHGSIFQTWACIRTMGRMAAWLRLKSSRFRKSGWGLSTCLSGTHSSKFSVVPGTTLWEPLPCGNKSKCFGVRQDLTCLSFNFFEMGMIILFLGQLQTKKTMH